MSSPRESTKIPANIKQAQEAARAAIAAAREELEAFARAIHADPEPPGAEVRAVERMTALLEARGFEVERELAGLPTAFHASFKQLDSEQMRKGLRHPHVAILAEYDADPALGHVFGRNLNAGAALAIAFALADAAKLVNGVVSVIGCPGGGPIPSKLALADTGMFEEFDAVLVARPAPAGKGAFFTTDSSGNTLASVSGSVRFAAQAGGQGDAGAALGGLRDALDLLAEELAAGETIDVSELGDAAGLSVVVRAARLTRVEELSGWLRARAESASSSHGVTASVDFERPYPEMLVSRVIIRRAHTHSWTVGLRLDMPRKAPPGEPTDWGAISQVTPTVDCWFPIGDASIAWGTPEFATAANDEAAYQQMFAAATAIALAGVDLLTDMNMRAIADSQLVRAMKERGVERAFRRWTGVHPVLPKTSTNGSAAEEIPEAQA